MPTINNIGNYNKTSDRKISSKLTFKVGENFKGKIIAKGEGKEVTIRMMDGWQFNAEVEGDVNAAALKFFNFKVEDFEGGKLKLKIVNDDNESISTDDDVVNDFVQKEGMSKEDASILKAMISHNIPLTKENITLVKSIVNFHESINNDPGEIDKFIDKYIASKNISVDSEQGQQIKQVLTDFFASFKDMTQDDIMFFLENNIDLTKENVESYNKLFNSENTISEYFDDIAKQIDDINLQMPEKEMIPQKDEISNIKNEISSKTIQSEPNETVNGAKVEQTKSGLASKIYETNDNSKGKVSMLSLLKTLAGEDVNLAKEGIKEVLIQNADRFTTSEFKNTFAKLNSIDDKKLIELLMKSINEESDIKDSDVKNMMRNIIGKDVSMSTEQMDKFKDIIETKIQQYSDLSKQDVNKQDIAKQEITNNSQNNLNSSNDNHVIKTESNVAKTQGNITKTENNAINGNGDKTNQSENSQLKEEVLKQSSTKESKSEVINGKLESLKSDLVAKDIINRSNKDIIKDDIKNKLDTIKDIVKDMVAHSEGKGEGVDKLMSLIKNNINDFKLLNSVSNEYYYADIPVNANGQEYPCKLIIKDSRKDGKQIDKTNVRLVVAVKTLNLGTVDGYLKVNNKSLHVDLKCDSHYVKLINKAKEKLVEGLQSLGYTVSVSVSQKVQEVNIITCRDFFEQKHDKAIDIRV